MEGLKLKRVDKDLEIDLSMVTDIQGLGIDLDFQDGYGVDDLTMSDGTLVLDCDTVSYYPRFILGFKDGEAVEFETDTHDECIEWMKRIVMIRLDAEYLQYLPFLEELKL